MSKIGFWETFFDDNISWREASAINEAHDAISMLQTADAMGDINTSRQVQKLFALDRAQSRQLQRMAATIDVLTELLIETGGIDKGELSSRVLSRVKQIEAAETEETRKGPTAQCSRCSTSVPASRTQITELGTVCDRCYYKTA